MENHKHFQAWLRLVRRLDWSNEQRDVTCVRAFSALQQTMLKCGYGQGTRIGVNPRANPLVSRRSGPQC